jgi:hypothetical protein
MSAEIEPPVTEQVHSNSPEKTISEHGSSDATDTRNGDSLSSEEERKLLRRIDWHLLPLMAIIYMVKTIDAANVRLFPSQHGRY